MTSILTQTARNSKHFLPLLLCARTILVFQEVRRFDYLAIDDGMHTEMNPKYQPVTFANILSFWQEPYENAFTPLTYTLWGLEALLAKNSLAEQAESASLTHPEGLKFDPGIFHLFNLIFHLASIILLFLILKLMFASELLAFAGSLLFAVHPLQVESVCWITGQRDVLAGMFTLSSIYFYLKYYLSAPNNIFWNPGHRKFYCLSLIFFVAGVLSKSSTLVTPLFIFLIGTLFYRISLKKLIFDLLPWGVLILPILSVFFSLNDSVAMKVVFVPPAHLRPVVALDAIGFYLCKLFMPYPLVMDYGRTPQFVIQQFQFWWTLPIALSAIFATLFCLFKGRSSIPFLCAMLFITGLIPVLGLNPFIFQHISTVADRYVYLSMFGASIGFCALFRQIHSKITFRTILYGSTTILVVLSALQVRVWKDNSTLFLHTLKFTPRSWLAANDLGTYFEGTGESEKAYELYLHAAQLSNIPSTWNNCGAMAINLNRFEDAIHAFQRAVTSSNNSPWAHTNLGSAYAKAGRLKEALKHYEMAKALVSNFKPLIENESKLKKHGLASVSTLQIVRKN